MKISEVTIYDLMDYAREDNREDVEVIKTFETILASVKSFIKSYTGLTVEEMDLKEDLTVALMVLSNEMYDNRIYNVQNSNVNKVVHTILNMHSRNLL